MEDTFESVQEKAEAYPDVGGDGVSPLFRGLCAAFRISSKFFESLVEDGWDDPEQLKGLSPEWRAHIRDLAPNGGQKRNLERMLERVDAGPLDGPAPKKQRVQRELPSDSANDKAGPSGASAEAAPASSDSSSTSSQVCVFGFLSESLVFGLGGPHTAFMSLPFRTLHHAQPVFTRIYIPQFVFGAI